MVEISLMMSSNNNGKHKSLSILLTQKLRTPAILLKDVIVMLVKFMVTLKEEKDDY